METAGQQLIAWYGGLGLFVAFAIIVCRILWKKLEEKDKVAIEIAKEFSQKNDEKDKLIREAVKEFQETIKQVVDTNEQQIKWQVADFSGKISTINERMIENRKEDRAALQENTKMIGAHTKALTAVTAAVERLNR